MSFIRVRNGEQVAGDREGARRFLEERGLRFESEHKTSPHLCDADGKRLSFDGRWSDLHLDPLEGSETFSGGIWHATLSDEECQFIFDLCVAAGFLVCNHQGDPFFIVPARNHGSAELEAAMDPPEPVLVDTATELQQVLAGGFRRFVEYRDRVVGGGAASSPD